MKMVNVKRPDGRVIAVTEKAYKTLFADKPDYELAPEKKPGKGKNAGKTEPDDDDEKRQEQEPGSGDA